jgi:hypothetical protein
MRRLLMIASSTAMRPDSGLLPALNRYDGPVYRLLRAHRAAGHRLPTILILSANYGLIAANHPIPADRRDERLTIIKARLAVHGRARDELRRAWWIAQDRFMIAGALHKEVFLRLAPRFEPDISPHVSMPVEPVYTAAHGRIDEQLLQLQVWLNGGGKTRRIRS